jgi:hypothetical protein
VYKAFQTAESASGGAIQQFFRLADFTFCFRFASSTLIDKITPAFKHLEVSSQSNTDLTINFWESASSGVIMPPPPWPPEANLQREEVLGYRDDRIFLAYQPDFSRLCLLDNIENRAIYWIRDSEKMPYFEQGAPLLMLLHQWLRTRSVQLVHGAAVGLPDGGVLLTGKGGAGKSSTAMACLGTDLLYAGDDYCSIRISAEPYIFSLYNSGKLDNQSLRRFRHLEPAVINIDQLDVEKALFFIHQVFPKNTTYGFPLKAILIPQVAGTENSWVSEISKADALKALAPSSIFQLSGANSATFNNLITLIRTIPTFRLNLGTTVNNIPEVIKKLLSEL